MRSPPPELDKSMAEFYTPFSHIDAKFTPFVLTSTIQHNIVSPCESYIIIFFCYCCPLSHLSDVDKTQK
jgi:hypothetical protein